MTDTPSRTEKLEEYKLIREEINKEWDYISNSRSVLFATTVAVLAFAFSQSNPFVFLIPYVVIIPLSAIEKDHLTGIIRKGAYLLVFCEPYLDIEWERRLFQKDIAGARDKKIKKPVVSHFMLLTLCCFVLSVLHLDFSDLKVKSLWIDSGLIAVLTIITVVIVLRNRVDYLEEKIVQKERWEEVKKKKSK